MPALGQKTLVVDMLKQGRSDARPSGWIAGKIRILNCEFGLSDYEPYLLFEHIHSAIDWSRAYINQDIQRLLFIILPVS
jgi:hypothetical protein